MIGPLPQLIHVQHLLARSALAAIKSPLTKPTEAGLEPVTGKHHVRIKANPASGQRLLALACRAGRTDFQTISSLAPIIKNKTAGEIAVEQIAKAESSFDD